MREGRGEEGEGRGGREEVCSLEKQRQQLRRGRVKL